MKPTMAASTAPAADDQAPPQVGSLRWLWRQERVGLPLCVGVAAFLTLISSRSDFLTNLVYSLCVGQLIQFGIEFVRYVGSARLRRQGLGGVAAQRHWPGWLLMGPWILIWSPIGYWLGMHLGDLLTGQDNAAALRRGDLHVLGPILMITLAVSVVTTYLFWAKGRLATLQAQTEAAERAAAENQLRLLQSQLEPHMLFNTLANLRVLIALDPPKAQAMLDQLVSFLRSTLQASRQSTHSLAEEFARISDYLALMQVRMGPRLQVSVDLPEALRSLSVPPLLLQPLVENSIKHGLEPRREGGHIHVSAQREGDLLMLSVRDNGLGQGAEASATGTGTGFGLQQVRDRLATLHGSKAAVSLRALPGGQPGTLAQITLPLTE
jgi:two-component sensor histidine kinase